MHLRHALIGHIDELALGPMYVYDGAADPVFVNLMADAITKRKVFDGGQLSTESLRHSQEKTEARDRAPMPFPVSANGSPASVTGSDTPAEVVPPKPSRAAIEVAEGDDLPVEIRPIEVSDSGPHNPPASSPTDTNRWSSASSGCWRTASPTRRRTPVR